MSLLRKYAPVLLAVLAAAILLETSAFGQCAMCRTALENSEEGKALAGSFRHGILLLMAAPYALLGTIGLVVFRAHRKNVARKREQNLYIP